MKLHFRVQGYGRPLILLHGFLGSLDNWRSVSENLSSDFAVFSIDLRNHGGSPHSDRMTYEMMANDLLEFTIDQKLSSVFLLGHSMGGKVAMQFALNNPEAVARLIVVDMAPRAYEPAHRGLLDALRAIDLSACKSYAEVDRALAATIGSASLRQFLLKNLTRGRDRRLNWRIDLEAIARNYDHLAAAIVPTQPFRNPTLFIRAGRSDYIVEDDIRAIREIFPEARVETISEAGHWVHVDAREEFLQVIRTFLIDETHRRGTEGAE